jgi:hypothetical protein
VRGNAEARERPPRQTVSTRRIIPYSMFTQRAHSYANSLRKCARTSVSFALARASSGRNAAARARSDERGIANVFSREDEDGGGNVGNAGNELVPADASTIDCGSSSSVGVEGDRCCAASSRLPPGERRNGEATGAPLSRPINERFMLASAEESSSRAHT